MDTETPAIDVTDATFESDVLARSERVPVVVDLWAPWCGPCRQLTPLLDDAVAATGGKVALAKVNIDENPAVSDAFQVQSIPAVYVLKDRKVVNGFVGAQGRGEVEAFIAGLLPSEQDDLITRLLAAGDEASLREVLTLDPDNEVAIVALAEALVARGESAEALELLARIPETGETRRVAALARTGVDADDDVEAKLQALLERVKDDEDARREYVDLLEVMGPDDPRTAAYRRQLSARLF